MSEPKAKSYFRVKYWAGAFFALCIYLLSISQYRPVDPDLQLVFLTIPLGLAGLYLFFLKCEFCGDRYIELEGGKITIKTYQAYFKTSKYLLPKNCPKCGVERY